MITCDAEKTVTLSQIRTWMMEHDKHRGSHARDTWQGMAALYWIIMRSSGNSIDVTFRVVEAMPQTGEELEWAELIRHVE